MTETNFTIKEASNKTKMSESWWRQRIFRKEIRYLKIGRRVFIPESVIEQIFRDGIVEPAKRSQR